MNSSQALPINADARRYAISQLSRYAPDIVFCFGDLSDIAEVRELERLEYRRAGYIPPGKPGHTPYYRDHFDRIPETHIMIARKKSTGQLVGTLSVTLDGSEGLPSDIDFPCETEMLRQETLLLAQVWRFAVDSEHRRGARIAHGLMSLALLSDFAFDVTTVVATIHPKHLDFYRMLGHEPIAYQPCAFGLVSAPAIFIGIVERRFTIGNERPWEQNSRPLAELAA